MQAKFFTHLFLTTLSVVFLTQISFAQSFSSGTVNATIDDNKCDFEHAKANITVSGLPSATSATFGLQEVCIRINHVYTGDVLVYLRSPNGTRIELTSNNGGSGDNYGSGTTYTCFRKTAANPITGGTAPFTANANYLPEGDLGSFNNGQNPNGVWSIFVCDNSSGTAGVLVGATLTFSPTPAVPVVVTPTSGDCFAATPICANTYSAPSAPVGAGTYADINTSDPNLCLGTESKSAWYVFTAQNSGNFGFILTPSVAANDYDWALFDLTGRTCSDIYTDPTALVSCNAYGVAGNTGTTTPGGLGSANNGLYNNQGEGSTGTCPPTPAAGCTKYNAQIPVTAGRNYVLYISNFNGTGGYGLDFSQSTNGGVIDILPPSFQSVVTPIVCGATTIRVRFSENVRCNSVTAADFVLTGPSGNITVTGVSSQSCIAGGLYSSQYDLTLGSALTQSGNYTVALAAGGAIQDNCGNTASSASLPFTITIADATFSYAATSVCKNTGGTATPTIAGTGGTFTATPAGLSMNASGVIDITSSAPGVYTVSRTVTQGACSDTRNVSFTINANPAAVITGTAAFCTGSTTTLTGTGGTSYAWSNSVNTAANIINTAGTYTVTATGAGGCTATALTNVAGNPLPSPSLSANTITCSTPVATLTASGGASYAFSGNASSPSGATASATTTGNYTVTVTHTNGCTASTAVLVTQNITPPNTTLTVDAPLTCTNNSANLTAANGTTYAWSNNVATSSGSAATATAMGTYTVTATNSSNGCVASATVLVTQNIVVPSISVTTPPSVLTCSTTSTAITVSGGNTYMWGTSGSGNILSGVNTATATVNAPATYIVTATNTTNGCVATSGVVVTQDIATPSPSISAPAVLTCSTTSTNLTASGLTPPLGAGGYTWSSNVASSSGATATVNTPTTYIVTATAANGCAASTSVVVTQNITPPVPTVSGNTYYCPTATTTLTAGGGSTYLWTNGSTAAALVVGATGNYTVTVTAANGCTATTFRAVTASTPPVLSGATSTCDPGSSSYNASFNIAGTSPFTVTYNSNTYPSGNAFTSLLVTGAMTFTATNVCGSAVYNATGVCAPPTTCGGSTGCFGTNLVVNPDFESGNTAFTSNMTANVTPLGAGTCQPGQNDCTSGVGNAYYTGANDILCQGNYGIDANVRQCNKFWSPNIKDHTSGTGKMMMIDFPNSYNAANNRLWCQNITLVAGTSYCFGAYFINLIPSTNSAYVDPIFGFTRNGSSLGAGVSVTEDEQWHFNGVSFVESTGGSVQLCINNLNAGGTGFDVAVDDISVRTVNNSGVLPVTTNDVASLCPGKTQVTTNVLANDLAGAGTLNLSTFRIIQAPPFSQAVINNINTTTGQVTVDFVNGYTGTTDFEYQICNTGGCCATAICTISAAASNPSAVLSATGGNALCTNTTKNIALSSITGGSGSGYTYIWSNAATGISTNVTPTISPTTYSVTVTDGVGCTTTATIALTINPLPTAIGGANTTICNNAFAALNASATGGTTPYNTYTWSDAGANPHNVNPSATTTYTVTVADANGCTASTTTQVLVNPRPTATIAGGTTPICRNASTNLSVSATGGSGTYTSYIWDNGLAAGTNQSVAPSVTTIYNVTVTDSNNCTNTDNVTVTINALPQPDAGANRAICAGGNTTLTATSSGGSGGSYTYAWSAGLGAGATKTVSPASTTTYNVTVTDGNGCQSSTAVTITVNAVAPANLTNTAIQYCTGRTATITCSNAGTYLWSNSGTSASIIVSPAVATTYTITVTDSNNCLSTASATVTPNANPVPTVAPAVVSFCTGSSGTAASATVFSSYLWSNGATSQGITVTTGGIYTVIVTDANGCTATASRNITQYALPVFSIAGTLSFCQGANTNLAVSGAVGTYAWSNNATSSNITVNSAGNFTVTVTNSNGCSSTRSVSTALNPLPTPTVTGNASFCYGGNSLLNAGTYSTYQWANASGILTGETTQTYNATQANTYTVTVSNSFGCTATDSHIVTQNSSVLPNISGASAICAGASTTLNAGLYNGYDWSNAGGTIATAAGQPNLTVSTAGIYTVLVTDAAGCTGSNSINIISNTNPTVAISGASAFCTGSNTVLSVPSTYSNIEWSNGFSGAANTAITVSTPDTYLVTVTNASGCTATAIKTVIENALPVPTVAGATAFCQGTSTDLTASAGAGTYTYLWSSTGETTPSINITTTPPTTYTVTVTNSTTQCSATATRDVSVSPLPTPSITTTTGTNAFCAGSTIGLGLAATGGLTNYQWSNASGIIPTGTAATLVVAQPDTYTVQVTNTFGCTATTTINVIQNTNPTANINAGATAAAFCQNNNVTLTATGGTAYVWSTGSTTAAISVGAVNTYTVTVTNTATTCTASRTISVTQNTLPTATITGTAAYCAGRSTTLTAGGAGAGGTYLWSTNSTAAALPISGTPAAAYTVTVTDANGCTATRTSAVTVFTNPVASVANNGAPQAAAFCSGKSITLTAPAGLTSYAWANSTGVIAGQTANNYTTSAAGTYTVTITNSNGCTGSATASIIQNNLPTASITAPTAFCAGSTVSLSANAGVGLGYLWNTAAASQNINVSPTATTTYTVTVTITATGCTDVATQTVTQNLLPNPSITGTTTYCAGSATTLTAAGGNSYAWSNGSGNNVSTINSPTLGTSTYTVTITSAQNCSTISTVAVTVNPTPTATINTTGSATAFCAGTPLTLTAPSGMTTYAWSDGTGGQTIAPLLAGVYTVTITNSAGCTASTNITLTQNALPPSSITATSGINGTSGVCAGSSISLSANSGAGLTYAWNTGASNISINPIPTATTTYTVTVTETATGCTSSTTQQVVYNALPTPTVSGTANYCTGASTTITANGGVGYAWSSSVNTAAATFNATTVGTTAYTVTVTNAAGCTLSTIVNVTVNALPTTTITSNGAACANTQLSAPTGLTNYTWSNPAVIAGANTNTYTPTAAGTYTVQAANGLTGCTATSSIIVNALPTANANINTGATTAAFCAGSTGAQLCLPTAINGNWSNGLNNTRCITVTNAGTYIVTVTSAQGCTATDAITVNQNALPTPDITGATVTCGATSTTLSVATFTSYLWSNSPTFTPSLGTNQTLAVNTTNTYYVRVTSAQGCSNTDSFILTQFSNPSPSIASSNGTNICNTASNTLTADAGYTAYQWSDINGVIAGATNATYTANVAGAYTVTVTAAGGCTGTQTINLNFATLPEPNINGSPQFCSGSSTNITVAGGGAGVYTYLWSNGQTTPTINVNTQGNYTATVTSAQNCTAVAQMFVTNNPNPQAGITGNATYCAGTTGTTLTASGGAGGPFNYNWSDGAVTAATTVNGLATSPTNYVVTVTNVNTGCSATTNVSVTENAQPSTTITATSSSSVVNSFCAGSSATLTTASGLSGYSWFLNGNPIAGAGNSISASTAGTYTVLITSNLGCTNTAAVTLTPSTLPTAGINANGNTGVSTAAFCTNGNVVLTATGGGTYVWSNSTNTANNTINAATTYTVTVTNAANCTATAAVAVTQNSLPTITTNGATSYCATASTTVTASGGTAYSWQNGANTTVSSVAALTVTGVPNNPYTVTVTNANGCQSTASVSLTANALPTPSIATSTGTLNFCSNQNITLTTGGGLASYQWSNASGTIAGAIANTYTTNTPGTYTVLVTNTNGCSSTTAITITPLTIPTATINGSATATAAFCQGTTATLTAGGGTTYVWSNTTNTAINTVTSAGVYTVTVTNAAGCTNIASVAVTQNNLPNPSIAGTSAYCTNNSTNLTASGGTAYNWGTGFVANGTTTINATSSAIYTVTVQNANGCTATATTAVTVNANPTASITSANPNFRFCAGTSIALDANSGLAPYTWSNATGVIASATGSSLVATTAGIYTVQVTNSFGCTATTSVSVTQNALPIPSISNATPFCVGSSRTITASISTPIGTGGFIWNNGTPSASLTVTQGGVYSVTVTDANGCTASQSASVTANALPTPQITGNSQTCSSTTTVLSLTSAYTGFNWSTNETTATINATGPQTYTVTVTNNNNCTATATAFVGLFASPIPTLSTNTNTNNICAGTPLSIATANTFNSYAWASSNGAVAGTTNSISVTQGGIYTVTVTNAQGCTGTKSISVTLQTPPTAAAAITTSNGNLGFCQGENFSVSATGATGATYIWNNGITTQSITVANTATHTVTVTDTNGCTASATVIVTQNQNPTPSMTANTTINCTNTNTILSTAVVYSSYLWLNPSATTPTVSVNASGTYTVQVTDANGCTGNTSTSLNVSIAPTPSISTTPTGTVVCAGSTLNIAANTGFQSYLWSFNNATTTSIDVPAAGIYTVTVTTNAGCTGTISITVTLQNPPTTAAVVTGALSFCQNGNTTITAGTAFSYLWSAGGQTSQSINVTQGNTYTVTVSNAFGCTASTNVVVTQNQLPSPSITTANGSFAVCSNSSIVLTVGDNNGGAGASFIWNTNATTAAITIQGNATLSQYIVTVTNASGCTATMATSVQVNQAPNTSISTNTGNFAFCPNGTVTLDGGAGFVSWVWSNTPPTTGRNLSVNTTGTYTVTVTNGSGCTATASASIIAYQLQTIAITNNANNSTSCVGTSVTLTAQSGFTNYQWTSGILGQNQTVNGAVGTNTYTVNATDNNGCAVTNSTSINIVALPTVGVTGSTNGTASFCGTLGTSLTATGGGTYNWNNPNAVGAVLNVTASGIHTVIVTSAQGCTASSSVVVTQLPVTVPTITTADNVFVICSNAPITLNAGVGFTAYNWGNTITTQTLNVTTAGIYTVTVTNANGCTASTSREVTTGTNPTIGITGSTQYCPSATTTITASGGGTYLWSNGITTASITAGTTANYAVIVTSAQGCKSSSTVAVSAATAPTVNIQGNTFICSGQTTTLDAVITGVTYQWYNGNTPMGTLRTQEVSAAGTYKVVVTNAAGCTASDARMLNPVASPILSITGTSASPNFCAGTSTLLTATSGLNNYVWSNGTTNVSAITVTTGGVYTVVASNGGGCASTATVTVVENALPTVGIQSVPEFCKGKSVIMAATGMGGTYAWSGGGTGSTKTVGVGGVYTITVTDARGCRNTASATLVENSLPNAFAGDDFTAYPGENFQLDAQGGNTYAWSQPTPGIGNTLSPNNIPNPTGIINATQVYTVTVTDSNNCTASDQITIILGEALECLGQSEGITPNNDGFNDQWTIGCLSYFTNKVQIFNRWGQPVFAAEQYDNSWGGTSDGVSLPDGTYYYVIIIYPKGNPKGVVYKGNVTIIR